MADIALGSGMPAGDRLGVRLPPLRDDLELLPAPPAPDGEPCWTIHDPVRNRFFRIGHAAFEAIARWGAGTPRAIAARVRAETLLAPDPEDVLELYQILASGNLTQTLDTAYLERQAAARRVSWFWWLIHNYLFFRIPLVHPDRFLGATLPLVLPFYSRAWRWVSAAAGVLGVGLALRQWDAFLHTFLHFFTWDGALLYGVTLFLTKALHELGHGYTAKRHGCRVHSMGVAFLVLWPVLYTDTTDAWRLVSRRKRLEIAAAGILVELRLAVFATLAWSFLPDGPLRSAAFLVATVTWVTTLAINLSPFMRFDGYYLLSDGLDVPNLQDRAFALARWRLRRLLFGLDEQAPERFPPAHHRFLLLYAYVTWVYRLVLFLGIALIVYHMFFKVLGLLLFAVEIGWFVLRPLYQEGREWWRRRGQIRPTLNLVVTFGALAGLVWLVSVPMVSTVAVPAVWRAKDFATVYPPVPARLEEVLVRPGQAVTAGTPLARLTAPELESRLRQVVLRIELLQAQVARQTASREGLDRVRVLEEDLAAALSEHQGLEESRARLLVTAPLNGVVVEVEDSLRHGRWVNPQQALVMVVAPHAGELVGYVAEHDLERVVRGAPARFYADDPAQPALTARVEAVDRVSAAALDVSALASVHGGPVAVESVGDARGRATLTPVDAVYRVTLDVQETETGAPKQVVRGVARVEAEARSLVTRFWQVAVAVLIREMGF